MKSNNPAIPATEKPKVAILGSEKAPAGALAHTLYFWYIEDLYRANILRREQPSGVVQGLGIWRWWVRFPPPRGHFLVGSGSLFRDFSDVLGSVWEGLGDLFRQVWEGFETNVRRGPKQKSKVSKSTGSIFPESGRFRITFLTYPNHKYICFSNFQVYRIFFVYLYIRGRRHGRSPINNSSKLL